MSFIVNVHNNDTLKYWSNHLKGKWYKFPFLLTKNKEIEAFESALVKHEGNNQKNIKEHLFAPSDQANNIKESARVAVVVPIFIKDNASKKQLYNLIDSLKKQTRKPYKVYLVDDASPVHYDSASFHAVKLPKNKGPAHARNIGVEKALVHGADIIAFTDADVIVSNDWIASIVNGFLKNKTAHVISGKTVSFGRTWLDKYHDINGTLNGRRFKDSNMLLYAPTCNLAVMSKCLVNQRFDTDFPLAAGEDIALCFNMLLNNYNIFHDNKVLVHHDHGYKWLKPWQNRKRFKNQFRRYAQGEAVLLKKFPNYYKYLSKTKEISNILK